MIKCSDIKIEKMGKIPKMIISHYLLLQSLINGFANLQTTKGEKDDQEDTTKVIQAKEQIPNIQTSKPSQVISFHENYHFFTDEIM